MECGMEEGDGAEYVWEAVPTILVREGENLEIWIRTVAVESEKWADMRIHYCLGRGGKEEFRRTARCLAWCSGSSKKSCHNRCYLKRRVRSWRCSGVERQQVQCEICWV